MKIYIKEYRNRLKMSQTELAERSGVSRQTISSIENGNEDVLVRTLVLLAEAMGTTVDRLFLSDCVK